MGGEISAEFFFNLFFNFILKITHPNKYLQITMSTLNASSLLSAFYMVLFMTLYEDYELKPSILYVCIPKAVYLDAGNSFNSSLVAIVAVEPEVLKPWAAASEGIQALKTFSRREEELAHTLRPEQAGRRRGEEVKEGREASFLIERACATSGRSEWWPPSPYY